MGYHDVAQICLNGHMINDCAKTLPQFSKAFCTDCGQRTVTNCSKCQAEIKGYYRSDSGIGGVRPDVPKFCHACGEPYPWQAEKLATAKALADEFDELSSEEREKLKGSLDELVIDSPRTELAVARFKKIMAKLGKGSVEMMKQITIELVTEAAKKKIWG
jgi:hypothetical protein